MPFWAIANLTAISITLAAATLNWRLTRSRIRRMHRLADIASQACIEAQNWAVTAEHHADRAQKIAAGYATDWPRRDKIFDTSLRSHP